MENPNFCIRMLFGNATDFITIVIECCIKNHRELKFKKNDKNKIRDVCNTKGCDRVVYIFMFRPNDSTLQVKTYNKTYNCGLHFDNKNINSSWLGKRDASRFREKP